VGIYRAVHAEAHRTGRTIQKRPDAQICRQSCVIDGRIIFKWANELTIVSVDQDKLTDISQKLASFQRLDRARRTPTRLVESRKHHRWLLLAALQRACEHRADLRPKNKFSLGGQSIPHSPGRLNALTRQMKPRLQICGPHGDAARRGTRMLIALIDAGQRKPLLTRNFRPPQQRKQAGFSDHVHLSLIAAQIPR
jgi:hypothetical protein